MNSRHRQSVYGIAAEQFGLKANGRVPLVNVHGAAKRDLLMPLIDGRVRRASSCNRAPRA